MSHTIIDDELHVLGTQPLKTRTKRDPCELHKCKYSQFEGAQRLELEDKTKPRTTWLNAYKLSQFNVHNSKKAHTSRQYEPNAIQWPESINSPLSRRVRQHSLIQPEFRSHSPPPFMPEVPCILLSPPGHSCETFKRPHSKPYAHKNALENCSCGPRENIGNKIISRISAPANRHIVYTHNG